MRGKIHRLVSHSNRSCQRGNHRRMLWSRRQLRWSRARESAKARSITQLALRGDQSASSTQELLIQKQALWLDHNNLMSLWARCQESVLTSNLAATSSISHCKKAITLCARSRINKYFRCPKCFPGRCRIEIWTVARRAAATWEAANFRIFNRCSSSSKSRHLRTWLETSPQLTQSLPSTTNRVTSISGL